MLSLEMRDDRSEKVRYDYTDYPIYIRRALLSSYPGYAAPTHWHDDIEFIAVLSGEMQYNVNGEIVTLAENEGIFVNARQMHFGFSPGKKECDFICILIHPLILCATYAYERDFVLPVINNKDASYIKLNSDTPWHRTIFKNIRMMYSTRNEKSAVLKIQNLFLNTWIQLYENIPSESQHKNQNADLSILRNMIGFIQQNYTNKITLADIAASGAVGQSKCCKLFAKYIKQTPNIYLTRYRLDKSTVLLSNTDRTVTEIATAVGFNGSSYYAEAFRKWYGKSPTEYRTTSNIQRPRSR
ncbi:AraC family transcriptional regulator [Bifidobacterium dentium]|uniref:AraC family transcriptional regulator n=1 Tax=Bifidobacterium dentium TaxID=1689 RepID=UPI0018B03BF5|nr:helix-turn-helix domain-containing protein [Bifidobacterium dentium]MBF9690434.1 AraC family transcriptional regulator [Bifidobacterium dentium]